MKKLFLLAIVVLGFTAVSFGQGSTTLSNATATAVVRQAITLTQQQGLDFGIFAVGSVDGTVIVTTTGVTTVTGAGNNKVSDGAQAAFTIHGPLNTLIYITKPSAVVTLTNTLNALKTMTINVGGFSADASVTTDPTTGDAAFMVGATLNFTANQGPGIYNGTYPITVNYL